MSAQLSAYKPKLKTYPVDPQAHTQRCGGWWRSTPRRPCRCCRGAWWAGTPWTRTCSMPPPPVRRLPLVAPLPAQQHRQPLLHGCRLHLSIVGNACQMLMHNNHCCCACISHDVQTLVLCNTQAVVDAVAALLSAGAFSPGQGAAEGGDTSGEAGASSSSGGGGRPAWALDFLARHLGDGRATAAPDTVMQVSLGSIPQAWRPAALASRLHAPGQHVPAN